MYYILHIAKNFAIILSIIKFKQVPLRGFFCARHCEERYARRGNPMQGHQYYNLIIIGAGAAGLFAASQAGKQGKKVLLLEHSMKIGEKIRISGGGRCNFTNLGASPENYLSQNPHFCKSAMAAYRPEDFIALVEAHKIPFHEKKLGQLFCDDSSQDIIEMLLIELRQSSARLITQCSVKSISKENFFMVDTNLGGFRADQVIIATGGLSIPQIGATDFAYRIAKQFGLNVIKPKPGLVPFTCKQELIAELAGISFDSLVTLRKTSFRENILFTHRGLSGPAILQISSYWNPGETVSINLIPGRDLYQELVDQKSSTKQIKSHLDFSEKFITRLGEEFDLSQKLCETSNAKLKAISDRLSNWQVTPSGTEGFAKAEVTVGGVDTNELNSKNMEVKKVPGLHFIGEAVDVTGWLGGYNFQWAWASAYAASIQ